MLKCQKEEKGFCKTQKYELQFLPAACCFQKNELELFLEDWPRRPPASPDASGLPHFPSTLLQPSLLQYPIFSFFSFFHPFSFSLFFLSSFPFFFFFFSLLFLVYTFFFLAFFYLLFCFFHFFFLSIFFITSPCTFFMCTSPKDVKQNAVL